MQFLNGFIYSVVTFSMSIAFVLYGSQFRVARLEPKPSSVARQTLLNKLSIGVMLLMYIGAVLIAALTPASWRGRVTFALVLAPPGALLRFEITRRINTRIPSFPLGTFTSNIFACAIFAMTQTFRRRSQTYLACSALSGLEVGFCGGLSTVTTLAAELIRLKKRDAFVYALTTWVVSQTLFVLILGIPIWTGAAPFGECATEP